MAKLVRFRRSQFLVAVIIIIVDSFTRWRDGRSFAGSRAAGAGAGSAQGKAKKRKGRIQGNIGQMIAEDEMIESFE
jgi:hypothetical protein